MNKVLLTVSSLMLSGIMYFGTVNQTQASPANANKAENNDQVVSFYPEGSHTVIQSDGSISYGKKGSDLVMKAGNSNTFQQWYIGENGEKVHSTWRNIGDDTRCPSNWLFVLNPHQPPVGDTWGYHFPEGDNYCVMSN